LDEVAARLPEPVNERPVLPRSGRYNRPGDTRTERN
jgi:hypothetical protein